MKAIRSIAVSALALALVGCGSSSAASTTTGTDSSDKVIRVGATEVPHAEILEGAVAAVLEAEGWTLEVTHFTDYVTPNTSLDDGSLDANYFQTLGYMENQNSERGFSLVASVGVHIEPMGIYSSTLTDISALEDGATITVPNDADNLDRGLRVLVQKGLLEDPGTDEYVTEETFNNNAELNPRGFVITPLEAATLPSALADTDVAVINGNYALEADLPSTYPALEIEEFDDETAVRRTNYIVVNEADANSEKTQALVAAITSDEVAQFIEDTYKGSVITSFIDSEGNAAN